MNIFFALLMLLSSFSIYAQREKVDLLSIGNVKLGEERLPLDLNQFQIQQDGALRLEAQLVHGSLQWVRFDKVLLLPRALMNLRFSGQAETHYTIHYAGQSYIPTFNEGSGQFETQLYVSLFEALPILINAEDGKQTFLHIRPPQKINQKQALVDYSCSPYQLQIEGITNDFMSVGCKIEKTGEFGDETPLLEVIFSSASYRTPDKSLPPYRVIFNKSGEARLGLVGEDGVEHVVKLKATLPKRIHRLRFAAGFGPYQLDTKIAGGTKREEVVPTGMLYGNFTLNDVSSIRAFDSYSQGVSRFHNWGTYFAWDLARFYDERFLLTSMLGLQGVSFKYNSQDKNRSQVIYPQGFELTMFHPFGLLNYKLTYGMFAGLNVPYDYQNLWIRFGQKVFYELNYIEWAKDQRTTRMLGFSVGFPLAGFF